MYLLPSTFANDKYTNKCDVQDSFCWFALRVIVFLGMSHSQKLPCQCLFIHRHASLISMIQTFFIRYNENGVNLKYSQICLLSTFLHVLNFWQDDCQCSLIFAFWKYWLTRPEVSEADLREPKSDKTRGIKVNTRTHIFESQYV